jgi:hypothetical protein
MIRFFAILAILAWALWFGGMIALMIFVIRLFNVSHDVGVQTAPILFRCFANYQIIVGIIACVAGTSLCIVTIRNSHAFFALIMIFALAAAIVVRRWTYEMNAMQLSGQSSQARFQTLHHQSSFLYTTQAILLFIAGIGMLITFPSRETISKTDQP